MVDPGERERTLKRIREICLGLPETSERLSHGAPTFFVREKRAFTMVMTDHHSDGRSQSGVRRPTGRKGCWSMPSLTGSLFRPASVTATASASASTVRRLPLL